MSDMYIYMYMYVCMYVYIKRISPSRGLCAQHPCSPCEGKGRMRTLDILHTA